MMMEDGYAGSSAEASKLLEAALEQMDGIIQGTRFAAVASSPSPERHHFPDKASRSEKGGGGPFDASSELSDALKSLHVAIFRARACSAGRDPLPDDRDKEIEASVFHWLQCRRRASAENKAALMGWPGAGAAARGSGPEGDEDAVTEVAALREQVRVQADELTFKARQVEDLEKALEEKSYPADGTRSQQQQLLFSSPGKAIAAMNSELVQLRNRLDTLERENKELRKLCGGNRTPKYLDIRSTSSSNNYNNETASSSLAPSDQDQSPMETSVTLSSPKEEVAPFPRMSPRSSSKGLRKIFGKIKRSNSGGNISHDRAAVAANPDDGGVLRDVQRTLLSSPPCPQSTSFVRGKLRATTAGRFGGGSSSRKAAVVAKASPADKDVVERRPFGQWNVDMMCMWLDSIGLGMYEANLRSCQDLKTGDDLATLPQSDMEGRLGMRLALHRKKLILAISARQEVYEARKASSDSGAGAGVSSGLAAAGGSGGGKLDHCWVTRWLDDIGLPQYKGAFLEARVDGRVLNVLTIDDLIYELGVGSLLHHMSVRRGIQVLRQQHFDGDCLVRRRGSSDVRSDEAGAPEQDEMVALWTNHRVMEWLKEVDLAEYAPNLRGSGVHGALMVYEPLFDEVLLADLLAIPANKTLLRRHLSIHFKDLVGKDMMRKKRDAKGGHGYLPLTPTAKAKSKSRPSGSSAFTLRRKKSKTHLDYGDLVCPFSAPHKA